MKALVKSALSRALPGFYLGLMSRRARAHNQRMEEAWGCVALTEKVLRNQGPRVVSGPFQGLEFSGRTFSRHLAPKLFGTYERELHPVLQEVLGSRYAQVLDVGSAEGYYAVGLALRIPGVPVHAFDTDSWARETVEEMARTNGVTNLTVHAACTPEWLTAHLRPESFILSDCEGYEDVLFAPDRVPDLRRADLLIELHEEPAPGVTGRLLERFSATHTARVIRQQPRSSADLPEVHYLSEDERKKAVDEFRGAEQQWLWLARKSR